MGKLEKQITRVWRQVSDHSHAILLLQNLNHIVNECKKELPSLKTLNELKGYVKKLYTYWNPNKDGSPIFSQRHFLKVIEDWIQTQEKWFEEEEDG